MIKNPKIGQPVYFLDDKDNIIRGKVSQYYSNTGTIAVDNFFYISKDFAFSSKQSIEKYKDIQEELNYLNTKIKNLSKQREKYATKLAKMLK